MIDPRFVSVLILTGFFAAGAFAQTGAVGAAGLGKAYESAGSSAAAGKVRQGMGSALERAVARGRLRAQSSTSAGRSRSRPRPQASASRQTPSARPADAARSNTSFRPVASLNSFANIAETISEDAGERAMLQQLFSATKAAFEDEVAKKGRRNNVSAAFTFFIAVNSMVFHDDPEPSDEALDSLWDSLDSVLDEMPEFATMSDRDKQEMYDTLIAFSGLVLAGHSEAKTSGDAATRAVFKELSGTMIRMVLNTSPDRIRFATGGLVLN